MATIDICYVHCAGTDSDVIAGMCIKANDASFAWSDMENGLCCVCGDPECVGDCGRVGFKTCTLTVTDEVKAALLDPETVQSYSVDDVDDPASVSLRGA